eukprot:gene47862-58635_t
MLTGRFRWFVVALLFEITAINYIDRSAIAFAIHEIEAELGLSPASVGLVLGAFGIGYILTALIGGIVSDIEPSDMAALEDELDDAARALGCTLPWPFMYMFVLQITAIPEYAITDLGVVDCVQLKVISPLHGNGGEDERAAAE